MSVVFSMAELINIAIGIERRGITFYDVMSKSTDDEMARATFQNLTEMEREHIQIFENMLREDDRYSLSEALNEEYADYFQGLIDNAVFTDDLITSEMATQADSDIKAIELGISAEKDTILFYYDLRDMMPPLVSDVVNRILTEEKSHLRQLNEIKRRLTAA